ncbi:hypothetical protein B0H16DRAFT_1478698 [Mycena metata]|uniref:Uncharacterized protein n=1 Tax=Mycena metata TaxID=1033252 RepID=A0AAD7MEC1_9AGAR|nr:hypothetical protein B0H16DRAFT_1478698 [Mycena metata]
MAFFTGSLKIFAVIAVFSSLQALADTNFRWDKLGASDKLVWTPCYSGLQCSLLQVPLDYSSAGTVSIGAAGKSRGAPCRGVPAVAVLACPGLRLTQSICRLKVGIAH